MPWPIILALNFNRLGSHVILGLKGVYMIMAMTKMAFVMSGPQSLSHPQATINRTRKRRGRGITGQNDLYL